MARPKSKSELVELSQGNFKKLLDYINSFTEEEQLNDFPEGTLNRNIRDVFSHLHHWHLMMLEWYVVGMRGEKPDMPTTGYTWKTVPELNRKIQAKYTGTDLSSVKNDLNNSFQKLQDLIQKHSNEDLFEKKKYKWTGSTSLGAYLISSTSSHYDWAYKLIKKAKKGETQS